MMEGLLQTAELPSPPPSQLLRNTSTSESEDWMIFGKNTTTSPSPSSHAAAAGAPTTTTTNDDTSSSSDVLLNNKIVQLLMHTPVAATASSSHNEWLDSVITAASNEIFEPEQTEEQLQSLLGILTHHHQQQDQSHRARALSFPSAQNFEPSSTLMPQSSSNIPVGTSWSPANRPYHSVDRATALKRDTATTALSPVSSGGGSDRHVALPPKGKRAPAKGWWKTEICKFWREGSGCRNGTNCRWAHGDEELRRIHPAHDVTDRFERESSNRRRPMIPETPSHNELKPAAAKEDNEWSYLPLTSLGRNQRASIIDHIWRTIRSAREPYLSLEENVFIAGPPGIQANPNYWGELLGALDCHNIADTTAQEAQGASCSLCGQTQRSSPRRVVHFSNSSAGPCGPLNVRVCDRCHYLAEEKAASIILPTMIPKNMEDRNRLALWGVKIAELLRACDDGSWVLRGTVMDIFASDTPRDFLSMHLRQCARLCVVMRNYVELLPVTPRTQLFTSEVLDNLSLCEWTAVAHQSALFLALIFSGFPMPNFAIPLSAIPYTQPVATPSSLSGRAAAAPGRDWRVAPSSPAGSSTDQDPPSSSHAGAVDLFPTAAASDTSSPSWTAQLLKLQQQRRAAGGNHSNHR